MLALFVGTCVGGLYVSALLYWTALAGVTLIVEVASVLLKQREGVVDGSIGVHSSRSSPVLQSRVVRRLGKPGAGKPAAVVETLTPFAGSCIDRGRTELLPTLEADHQSPTAEAELN
jgi:hypothetical protein